MTDDSSPQTDDLLPATSGDAAPSPATGSQAALPAPPQDPGFAQRVKRALGMRTESEKQALELYRELAMASATPGADIDTLTGQIASAAAAGRAKPQEIQEVQLQAFRAAVATITADDVVTEDEEAVINGVADALGMTLEMLNEKALPELTAITIARANDGRLPSLEEHELFTQPGEEVHHETVATLLKEVTIREYQGGYGGVSFRVAKGVRINTGRTRGRMVPVGTEIQPADVGIFSITNRRAVYAGQRKTLEFKYEKLVGVKLYDDAITLQVSNRQTPSTFSFDSPEMVGAILNAAAVKSA